MPYCLSLLLSASLVDITILPFLFVASAFVSSPFVLLIAFLLDFHLFHTRSWAFPSGWLTRSENCNCCCWAVRARLHLRHHDASQQESDCGSQPWWGHLCFGCSPEGWQLRSSREQFLGSLLGWHAAITFPKRLNGKSLHIFYPWTMHVAILIGSYSVRFVVTHPRALRLHIERNLHPTRFTFHIALVLKN